MARGSEAKAALRVQMQDAIAALPVRQRSIEEDLVNAALVSDPAWAVADTVLVYKHKGHELSIVAATNAAFRAGKRVLFPRVTDLAKGRMVLQAVGGWDGLFPGAFGVDEPAPDAPVVPPEEVDLAVVPGLAFDAAGRRLGHGGGFYDRLLSVLDCPAWGVAFDVQVVPEVPVEPHDRSVGRVVHAASLLSDQET